MYQTITCKLGFYTLEIWVHCHSVNVSYKTPLININWLPTCLLLGVDIDAVARLNFVHLLATSNVYCYVIPQYQKRPLGLPLPENGLFPMYHKTFHRALRFIPVASKKVFLYSCPLSQRFDIPNQSFDWCQHLLKIHAQLLPVSTPGKYHHYLSSYIIKLGGKILILNI